MVPRPNNTRPLPGGAKKSIVINVPSSRRGKYYLESWSFRRADSALSTGRWIRKGQGNSVTK